MMSAIDILFGSALLVLIQTALTRTADAGCLSCPLLPEEYQGYCHADGANDICQESGSDDWECDLDRNGGGDDAVLYAAHDETCRALVAYGTDAQGEAFCCIYVTEGFTGRLYVYGGVGDDTISMDGPYEEQWDFDVAIYGMLGVDTIDLGDSSFFGTAYGGVGGDIITGGAQSDAVYGDSGSDNIWGEAETDFLHGGDHSDDIFGDNSMDMIWGDAGNDHLRGGNHADKIQGGDGADTIEGGSEADILFGECNGNDVACDFLTVTGADTISGGDGTDTLCGDNGDDDLYGDAHADLILGGNGSSDESWGGTGSDTCEDTDIETQVDPCETSTHIPYIDYCDF